MERLPHSYLTLPAHKKSFALISASPADAVQRTVIFVHGFNGSARGTWTDFLSLVDGAAASEWWEMSDLYFFHYQWESVFSQLVNNTLAVYKIIRSIFPSPCEVLGAENTFRNKVFRYRELVLVGHSEGGLLLRKAILEIAQRDANLQAFLKAKNRGDDILPPSSEVLAALVRLFAPALGGEMLTGLLGVLSSLPVISNALLSSAAKRGMNPSSAAVTEARRQTDRYADNFEFVCFRAHILWAESDLVISGEKYENDRQCLNFPKGTNHVSVCKPRPNYLLPLDFVELGIDHNACQ